MTLKALLYSLLLASLVIGTLPIPTGAEVNQFQTGQWSGGAGLGFLGNTVDGTVFALKGHADYFLNRFFSVGPLAQFAVSGDLTQFGLSVQAKYWWDIPGSNNLAKLVLQGGIGFVKAARTLQPFAGDSDASFLIPLGVGLDYTVTKSLALTADFLLNITDLNTFDRLAVEKGTNVMPGLYFGIRF